MDPLSIAPVQTVAGQLGLKSSRPLSQVGPGSTRPGAFSERSVTYMYMYMIYALGFCIIFLTKSKINIKNVFTNIAIKLLIDQFEDELAT